MSLRLVELLLPNSFRLRGWTPALVLLLLSLGLGFPCAASEPSSRLWMPWDQPPGTFSLLSHAVKSGEEEPQEPRTSGQVTPPPAFADSPPLSAFPSELGRNTLALFSKGSVSPLLWGAGITAAVHPFDVEVADQFQGRDGLDAVAWPGDVLGGPAVMGSAVAALFVGSRFAQNTRFRSFSYTLAQSWIIDKALVAGLKAATSRERPDGSNESSFPSGVPVRGGGVAVVVTLSL